MITATSNIVLMGEQVNTFLDNAELTELNYLTHILDFDYEHDHNDLLESIQISEYYTELDFIKKCTPDTCTIMSINCQSLNAKYDYIKLLLNVFTQHEQPIQIVCLQETWIEDASLLDLSLFQIHDYNLVTQDRYSVHGGLALYIHKNWSYTVKPCENKSLYWEEMFVTLADPLASNPTKICIVNFYRPPHTHVTQLISFIDYFNNDCSIRSS